MCIIDVICVLYLLYLLYVYYICYMRIISIILSPEFTTTTSTTLLLGVCLEYVGWAEESARRVHPGGHEGHSLHLRRRFHRIGPHHPAPPLIGQF